MPPLAPQRPDDKSLAFLSQVLQLCDVRSSEHQGTAFVLLTSKPFAFRLRTDVSVGAGIGMLLLNLIRQLDES